MVEGLRTLRLDKIKITDSLFKGYMKLVAEKMIPYQWNMLNERTEDTEQSSCIRNFRIAAGELDGERKGIIFQDTDLYKWIEAVAYCIENGSGSVFESTADEVIELIGRAQQEDGYINTYFTLVAPDKRWKNLVEGHELYCGGHLIEAAVAYYAATGKNNFLKIAEKFADCVCKVFGNEDGQIKGYPGHQEIELALIKLYRVTKNKSYLDCAKFFIEERGKEPNYFLNEINERGGFEYFPEFDNYDPHYSQSHLAPIKQRTAEGHAVRAVYMYSAMADLAIELNDIEMKEACEALWNNLTRKRMYITGGIGSSGFLERFTTDYDLPNNINYSETCASIGLMMFGKRMNVLTKDARYYDTVERALYNTVLAGMNITGDRYFYVNPLEVVPEFCKDHTYMQHIKAERQEWFHCACCPPNVARTLASLGQYIYAQENTTVYINQFISSIADVEFDGVKTSIELVSSLMKDGTIKLIVKAAAPTNYRIKIRIPEYAGNVVLRKNDHEITTEIRGGYFTLEGSEEEQRIDIDFDIKPHFVSANMNVRADEGMVALVKGPCVYCLEEEDNGGNLASLYVRADVELSEEDPLDMFGEIPTYIYEGVKLTNEGVKEDELYGKPLFQSVPVKLKAVPYCFWNNRSKGEMSVWQKVRF